MKALRALPSAGSARNNVLVVDANAAASRPAARLTPTAAYHGQRASKERSGGLCCAARHAVTYPSGGGVPHGPHSSVALTHVRLSWALVVPSAHANPVLSSRAPSTGCRKAPTQHPSVAPLATHIVSATRGRSSTEATLLGWPRNDSKCPAAHTYRHPVSTGGLFDAHANASASTFHPQQRRPHNGTAADSGGRHRQSHPHSPAAQDASSGLTTELTASRQLGWPSVPSVSLYSTQPCPGSSVHCASAPSMPVAASKSATA
jgi:hypothetical protein